MVLTTIDCFRVWRMISMERKDFEPISFQMFQSDVEKMLFFISEASKVLAQHKHIELADNLGSIVYGFQSKIDVHRRRGEWV